MEEIVYQSVALIGIAWGAVRGFNLRFTRQIPRVVAIAFGIVAARLLSVPFDEQLSAIWHPHGSEAECDFMYATVASSMIFLTVYLVFVILLRFVGKAMARLQTGILDNLGGALIGAITYVILISVGFNLFVCTGRNGALLRCARSDDGNVAHSVMLVAPILLGSEDIESLAHELQLEQARTIS